MADRTDEIAQALQDMIEARLAPIPGVGVVRHSLNMQWRASAPPLLSLRVAGYGPSLHERDIHWRQDLGHAIRRAGMITQGVAVIDADRLIGQPHVATPDLLHHMDGYTIDEIVAACSAVLDPVVDLQRKFAATAAGLGLDAPIPVPSKADDTPIGHIAMSVPLIDALVARYGAAEAARVLTNHVHRIVRTDRNRHDDRIMMGGGAKSGFSLTGYDGVPAMIVTTIVNGMAWDGEALVSYAGMPETVMAAAVGRRVGDVAQTGVPQVDDVVIVEVFADRDGDGDMATVFLVDTPSMPIGDHADLAPHLAPHPRKQTA